MRCEGTEAASLPPSRLSDLPPSFLSGSSASARQALQSSREPLVVDGGEAEKRARAKKKGSKSDPTPEECECMYTMSTLPLYISGTE